MHILDLFLKNVLFSKFRKKFMYMIINNFGIFEIQHFLNAEISI